MTADEDSRVAARERAGGLPARLRRPRLGPRDGPAQRFDVKHFLFGLFYGFALGFILEAILASHP